MSYIGLASLILLVFPLGVPLAQSQGLPPTDLPPEIQVPIAEMHFEQATTIEGRVLYPDTYDDALWIEWVRVLEPQGWREVPDQRQFVVYPTDPAMMDVLKKFPRGTTIRLVVQRGANGKRMILSLDEL